MKILIDVTHPAHAWFFKPLVPRLQARGDEVRITSRDKDLTLELLDAFGLAHRCLSQAGGFPFGLVAEVLRRNARLVGEIRRFRPDVVLARDGAFACQAAWLGRVPSVSFDDTDDATLQRLSYFPFATRLYTDRRYGVDAGSKHRRYEGVSALAYLRPDVFIPDREVLVGYGLDPGVPLVILRLVSWTASHDFGQSGLARSALGELVQSLAQHARVVISSEVPLPPRFEAYRLAIRPVDVHHLMAFADLYVGESATMAAEAAVLGTHAIYVSTRHTWYTRALEDEFSLLQHAADEAECLQQVAAVLADAEHGERIAERRAAYLEQADDLVEVALAAVDEFR